MQVHSRFVLKLNSRRCYLHLCPSDMLAKTDTDAPAAEQDRAAQREQLDQTVNEREPRPRSQDHPKHLRMTATKRSGLGCPWLRFQSKMSVMKPSDITVDDTTARLGHEEAREEGRVDRKTARDSKEVSSGSNGPKRLRTGCLRVSSVNALHYPPTESEERTKMSRADHIKHVLDTGDVKDWN